MKYNTVINNIKKASLKLLMFAMLFSFSSCSDFLNEYSQDTAYVRSYNDLDELLLGSGYMPIGVGIHIGMDDSYIDQPYYYPYIHLMGDELEQNIESKTGITSSYEPAIKYFGYYTWQQQVGINPEGTQVKAENSDWNRIYKHINIANMVLASIDNQDSKNDDEELEKQRIKGEAYFLRGAYYFVLANLYAKAYNPSTAKSDLAVPIKLTEYIEDKDFNRNTVEEVYTQVISDLENAASLLSGTTRKSYYRANATSALLLLSRVYLYKQDWSNAIATGQKVIAAGDSKLEDLNTMNASYFLNPQLPEIIFSMGTGCVCNFVNGDSKNFGITSDLYTLYTEDDLRSTYFVKYNRDYDYAEYVKGGVKSEQQRSSLSGVFLLRIAEAYLNVAEAAACSGDENTARNMINTLRSARLKSCDYTDVTDSSSKLIEFIRDERERELCLEGHRWFDLRRYAVNKIYPFSKIIRHGYTEYTYDWYYGTMPTLTRYYQLDENDDAYTLPIPKEVVDFSNGMINNQRKYREVKEIIKY